MISIQIGTTEIVVIDNMGVIDGHSSPWASDFVTRKIGRFAHLDVKNLYQNKDLCKKYFKLLAENIISKVCEMSAGYNDTYS